MYIPSKKIPLVHNLIENIYGATLNEVAIQTISRKTCSILDAHYFALMLFSGTTNPDPRVISNNPPEFLQAYNEVYKEDFLTKAVVTTGETSVLQRIPGWSDRKNQNFLATLASVRPASDGIYVPIKTAEGTMQGLWAIARAGLDSPPFSDNEIEVFHFISEFLSDAYKRSSLSSTMEDDIAFLDYQGHILQAGSRIQATFKEVFGLGIENPGFEKKRNFQYFISQYRKFLHNPYQIQMDSLTILTHQKTFMFKFDQIPFGLLTASRSETPCAKVVCIECKSAKLLHCPATKDSYPPYYFTNREREVLTGIFKGMSNKEIAYRMKVDESTVKRHTHNIYEKAGVHSRVELVLSLPINVI